MASLEKKYLTVVSVDFELDNIAVGEKVLVRHDKDNQYDRQALKVFREKDKVDIGYVSASPHTIKEGCVSNKDIFRFIPSATVPLVGIVVRKTEVNFKNGSITPALVLEVTVVNTNATAV